MDWVPGHFPKDDWALARFDGEPLYEHADPRRGEQLDWGTYVFDYGNPRVRNFLVANALFWLEEFHVDGLRVDAVASMLYLDYSREEGQWEPNIYGGRENLEAIGFLQEASATAYKRNPGIVMIAEESTSWPGVTAPTSSGGLGFGYKWNMGWMHDTLQYIQKDPMYRSHHHNDLTFSFLYAFSEHFVLPISHDEVVHGKGSLIRKMPGDHWQQLANVRAYLSYMWAHPGKQLLFMGQEFGQLSEWSEERGLDWWILDQPTHKQLAEFVGSLNRAYRAMPQLWQLDDDSAGFEWVEGGAAAENVIAFLRYDRERRPLLCIVNFAGRPHDGFRVGLPGRRALARGAELRRRSSSAVRVSATSAGSRRRCPVGRATRVGRVHPAPARGGLVHARLTRRRQYSRLASRRRAAATRGSSVPTTSNISTMRSRTSFLPSASSDGNSVQQAIERVVDVAAREVEVGHVELGAEVVGCGCRGRTDLVERLALQAGEQVHLREPGARERVARVLRDRGAIGGCRGIVVAALDGVVRLLVQRRQRRLDRLGARGFGARLAGLARFDAAGHAVLRRELEQLVEHLRDRVVGLDAREERHRLAGDQRRRPWGSTAPGTPARAAGCGRRRRRRARAGRRAHARVARASRAGPSTARSTTPRARRRPARCARARACGRRPRHRSRRRSGRRPPTRRARRARAGSPAAGAARAPTGRRHRAGCARGRDRVRHGTSDAPMRLSDQPSSRICWFSSPAPTPGT